MSENGVDDPFALADQYKPLRSNLSSRNRGRCSKTVTMPEGSRCRSLMSNRRGEHCSSESNLIRHLTVTPSPRGEGYLFAMQFKRLPPGGGSAIAVEEPACEYSHICQC